MKIVVMGSGGVGGYHGALSTSRGSAAPIKKERRI